MNIDRTGSEASRMGPGCADMFAVAAIESPRWFNSNDVNADPLEWPITKMRSPSTGSFVRNASSIVS